MSTFSFPVRDLFIATGLATETTTSTFIASASAGEVAVLKKDGTAVAASGSDAYVVAKEASGRFKASDVLKAGQIKSVTKVDPVTPIPAYASFPVSVSGVAAGDIYSGLVRIPEFITRSVYDEYTSPFWYTFESGDTVAIVSDELIKSLSFGFSRVEGQQGTYVHFKTGYVAVYTTEAAAVADVASLDDGNLVWVIANDKPYTVVSDVAVTFATIFAEKADWSTELTAGDAEYLRSNPWFSFVKTDAGVVYIIAKPQATTDMKLQGYDINFLVGLSILDATTNEEQSTVTVTNVGKVVSAGDGKRIRQLEIFTKGHTGDFYRGMGYPNNFDATYDASASVNYYIINVEFYQDVKDVNTLSGHPSQKLLQIACADGTTATDVYDALVALV